VKVVVDTTGHVSSFMPSRAVTDSCLDAIQEWTKFLRFRPAQDRFRPVPCTVLLPTRAGKP